MKWLLAILLVLGFEAQATSNRQAREHAEKLAGKNVDELYGLSTEIAQFVAQKYNGDQLKIQKAMEEAQRDPASFYQSLPPHLVEKVGNLANKIPPPKKP